MSGLILIIYIILGIILYLINNYCINKYNISKIHGIIISLLYIFILGGLFSTYRVFTGDLFIIYIFYMIMDIIYTTYIMGEDFFSKDKVNYYLIIIILGYLLNKYFINKVDTVFLTSEELKIVIWILIFISLYKYIKNNSFFNSKFDNNKSLNDNDIRIQYTKYKNKYNLKYEDKDIELLIYSIMIINNRKRNNLMRFIDSKIFEITGKKRKLSIMLIDSDKDISDLDGIDIKYKELIDLKKKSKSIINIVDKSNKEDSADIIYVYNTLKDFLK